MIIVLDTETTGREPPEVIELAYGYLNLAPLKLLDTNLRRFRPEKGSCPAALATHHILDEELAECPPAAACTLPPNVSYILGHNVDYDWTALGKPPVKRICTLAIARTLYPQESHGLSAMIYRLFPPATARELVKEAHSAEADILLCFTLLVQMTIEHKLSFSEPESLWQFSEKCRIPTIMAFGKHKGTPIKDLPRDYKQWLLRQPDMDPYVVKAVKEAK